MAINNQSIAVQVVDSGMQTSFEVVQAVTKVEVGIQYSPPQSDADSEVMQNEAEPLNVIISS